MSSCIQIYTCGAHHQTSLPEQLYSIVVVASVELNVSLTWCLLKCDKEKEREEREQGRVVQLGQGLLGSSICAQEELYAEIIKAIYALCSVLYTF